MTTENEKNTATKFVGTNELNDKPTIQIEIAIEINVGRRFRIVTIVQVQSLQSNSREPGSVLGWRDQRSGKKIRLFFVRFQESGRVSGNELKLYFDKTLASWNLLSWIKLTSNSFSEYEKLGVKGKGWFISDGKDDFYLLNKNNSNIMKK